MSQPYRLYSGASLAELQEAVHKTAVDKGWWDLPDLTERNFGELMMLVVTEVAECYEHYRDGQDINEVFYKGDKPDGIPIELADVLIRCLDIAEHFGIDLEKAVLIKMKYNETRPHRHGGKRA